MIADTRPLRWMWVANQPKSVIGEQARSRRTRARFILDGDIEVTNDNDDPFTFDPQDFNFARKGNNAFVDYAQAASPMA